MVRAPIAALRPFVRLLWSSGEAGPVAPHHELALPTGVIHLVFRLTPSRLRITDARGERFVGKAAIGGPRSQPYVRDLTTAVCSVGAVLHPGGYGLLIPGNIADLAERHVDLDDVWKTSLHDRLLEATSHTQRISLLERALLERVPTVALPSAVVCDAVLRLRAGEPLSTIVRRSGYSHRQLIVLFRRETGLTPKLFGRIARFQRAVTRLDQPLASLAVDVGFSDQSHMTREFAFFAGMSPLALRPARSNHVKIVQDARYALRQT